MTDELGQLSLDPQPEPAVAVRSTYSRGYFADRDGLPRHGGYVLALVETPFVWACGRDEEAALVALGCELRAHLRGRPTTNEQPARALRAADEQDRLVDLLRAGLSEPVLAEGDEPRASRPRRSETGRRHALALEDMWRADARCSSLPRSERSGWANPGDFLRLHLQVARRTFSRARAEGAPVCCSFHDGWDGFWDWPGSAVRAKQLDAPSLGWPPPCGVFHAGESTLSLAARLRGIASLHWLYLRPGRRARAFREQIMFDGPLGPPRVRRPVDAWLADLCRLRGRPNPGLGTFVKRVTR